MLDMLQGPGMEQMGMNMQEMLGGHAFPKKRRKNVAVTEARKVLTGRSAEIN